MKSIHRLPSASLSSSFFVVVVPRLLTLVACARGWIELNNHLLLPSLVQVTKRRVKKRKKVCQNNENPSTF
jgi:hypothetical protein